MQVGDSFWNRHRCAEFADYIMFGEIDCDILELIRASMCIGTFCTDPDMPYAPGVRLYIDAYRLIRDGPAVRDGLHLVKVFRRLPLHPYLLSAITPMDADPEETMWTPRRFTAMADEVFRRKQLAK